MIGVFSGFSSEAKELLDELKEEKNSIGYKRLVCVKSDGAIFNFNGLCGAVVYWLSLLHNFILQSLNSGSAQVQILLTVCWRFAMVRISDNGPSWK